jgi:hypothetical protein
MQATAVEWVNWLNTLHEITPQDIMRIQADTLRHGALMINDLSRGTKSVDRAEAIDEARDLLIDEAFQLSPPNDKAMAAGRKEGE